MRGLIQWRDLKMLLITTAAVGAYWFCSIVIYIEVSRWLRTRGEQHLQLHGGS